MNALRPYEILVIVDPRPTDEEVAALLTQLGEQIKATKAELTARRKKPDDIDTSVEKLEMDYRYRLLEARTRIHGELSPTGLFNLKKWLKPLLAGTTVRLRGRSAKNFRLPG